MSATPARDPVLALALKQGDPERVARLIAAGGNIRYRDEKGYDALIDAVHGRDVRRDSQLLSLLTVLVDAGVDLNGVTQYQESGLRVLSRLGRFDAVQLLLAAGANPDPLGFTPLIRAVALGSLDDVEATLATGAPLEEVDSWERTAWLVALLVGDKDKAKALLAAGAVPDARGRCGSPALFYAVAGHHPQVVKWLLDIGQPVDGVDEFGHAALTRAVEHDDVACVEVLLAAGASVAANASGDSALGSASSRPIVTLLLEAGADPQELSTEGRRALLGYSSAQEANPIAVSREQFDRARTRRFGASNPERTDEPFWEHMIRSGISAWEAIQLFDPASGIERREAIWCAQRFGQSLTFLPDGRIIQIGGEHEDHYDPDFCIYNDVFVHGPEGSLAIYSYPREVFPPTDFHTATLIGDHIYIIGSVGYGGTRQFGETPVYRLDGRSLRIEQLRPKGEPPGWISRHRALLVTPREIQVSGGKLARLVDDTEDYIDNTAVFVLDVERLQWKRTHL
jgi:ankyrin repeat protein